MAGFSFQSLINDIEDIAHKATEVLPAADLVDEGAQISKAILDLIDSVKTTGKGDIVDLDNARHTLATAVNTESVQLSKELRGE